MSDKKSNSKATKEEKTKGDQTKDGKSSEAETGKTGETGKSGTAVVDLGFLEADDDFEEFPTEAWKSKLPGEKEVLAGVGGGGVPGAAEEDDAEANIWEDNWDDDNIEEDFSKQLKAELEKRKMNIAAETSKVR
ncbi:26S proteasome complex subunit SEM1 [Tyrophagus putrescentiae]|nr:26S proteasome complex subunit SEM1 [Tyrophagus putrescentiae]